MKGSNLKEDAFDQLKKSSNEELTAMAGHFRNFQKSIFPATDKKRLVLFAIDEAKTLADEGAYCPLDVFRVLLREMAISHYSQMEAVHYFGLLLDTHGKIYTFTPKDRPKDPSLRKFSTEKEFFAPLSILQFRREPVKEWWTVRSRKTETDCLTDMIMNQGRYLWKAYRGQSSMEEDIQFGSTKLLAGRNQNKITEADDKRAISMAILGCRVAVTFHCSERLASEMVSSHMGVCYYIDPENGFLLYGYPSEPLLSLSASYLLNSDGPFNWVSCLQNILPSFKKGLVGAGVRGELVCRILLSVAWDKCQPPANKLHAPITVSQFLKQLGGTQLLEAFQVKGCKAEQVRLLEGRIYFTHFVYVDFEVSDQAMLSRFLSCGQAVLCRNNQQAIDLLFPVILSDGKTLSFIAVQCKNRKQISWKGADEKFDCVRMGFSKDFDAPYLVLCMQVGKGGATGIINLMTGNTSFTGKKNIIAMTGLEESVFPILKDPRLKDILESFQVSWEDPLSYFDDKQEADRKMLRFVMSPTYGWVTNDNSDAMEID